MIKAPLVKGAGSGAGGGATGYDSVAAVRAAAASLADGDVVKVTGVDWCTEVESGALVVDPLRGGVLMPAALMGLDVANGYTVHNGTVTEEADGLQLILNDAATGAIDTRFGEGAGGTYTKCVQWSMPLGAITSGESFKLHVRASVHRVVSQANFNLAVGVCDSGDLDVGAAARAYYSGTFWKMYSTDYSGGGGRNNTDEGATLNTGVMDSETDVEFILDFQNYGRRFTVSVDTANGSKMNCDDRTLADAHALVVHLEGGSAELDMWIGGYVSGVPPTGECRFKIKSVSLHAPT